MKKLLFLFLINFSIGASAQTTLFDQPNAALLQLNSSYAGSNGGFRAQSSFRRTDQISAQVNLAVDGYVKRVNGGLFLYGSHNEISQKLIVNDFLRFGYAQHVSLFNDELKIIPSFQLSLFQSVFSQRFSSAFNPMPLVSKGVTLSYALLFKYKSNYVVGMSIFDIHAPAFGFLQNEQTRNRELCMHAAYTFHLSKKRLIQVMTICNKSSSNTEISLHVNGVVNHFMGGIGVKSSGNYVVTSGYRGDFWTLQASYSVNYSRLFGDLFRVWELHLSANIRDAASRHELTNIENW